MQKNIAFYISDHNEEHVGRTIPLLHNLLKMDNEGKLFVKSGKEQIKLIKESIGSHPNLLLFEMEMRDCEREMWDELADAEIPFLQKEQIGLVVSDICPWIFIAADQLRIKSLLAGNYTWADLSGDEEEKEDFLSCYELASRIFIYDLHRPEMTGYGVEYEFVSMMNRPYHMGMIGSLEDKFGGPFVFADVPGMEPVNVSAYPYRFVVTEGTCLEGDNVTVLKDSPSEWHNYVAASTYVVCRGSWNRISDVVLSNKKAAFLEIKDHPMSAFMIDILKKRGQCVKVSPDEWSDMGELLHKLEEFTYSYDHEYYNSDYDLARKILYAYPEKRRRNRS